MNAIKNEIGIPNDARKALDFPRNKNKIRKIRTIPVNALFLRIFIILSI